MKRPIPFWSLSFCILFFLLAACGNLTVQTALPLTPSLTSTFVTATFPPPTLTWTPLPATSTPDPRLPPEDWQAWPVVPERVSPRVLEIYQHGLELGSNPQAYSKIGDCEATPAWFLGAFDGKPEEYSLGEYVYLQEVIDNFRGSHSRTSLAAGRGYSTANVLSPLWADSTACETNETPLACEIRLQRPSFALVALGSNDVYHQDGFTANMRQILDFLIENGVVPILATKADNLEGDHAINLEIARLAYEYDLPLWNFWLAIQPLPDHGLQEDGAHLTWAGPYFDDPNRMLAAWPWRNLSALQTLDSVWRGVVTGQ
jgi:hypothetical protein